MTWELEGNVGERGSLEWRRMVSLLAAILVSISMTQFH
jgi:hypothetical protein